MKDIIMNSEICNAKITNLVTTGDEGMDAKICVAEIGYAKGTDGLAIDYHEMGETGAEIVVNGSTPVVDAEIIKTNKEELIETFEKAVEENALFIGMSVMTEEYVFAEIIIVHISNYAVKLKYLLEAYDDDLMHINKVVQITGHCIGNTYDDIQDQLSV